MAVIEGGTSAALAEVGAAAAKGFHTISKPTDAGALGHYHVSVVTGTLAAALAANAQLYQFKWTDATRLVVITSIEVKFETLTRFTAGTITDFGLDALIARPFAAGGGGTTLTLTGNNNKMRTSFGSSLATINVSTTAALTAATGMDLQPFAQSFGAGAQLVPSATLPVEPIPPGFVFNPDLGHGEHPLVLVQNEGIVIRNRTVWPAGGTGVYMFSMKWTEVTAF